MLGSESIVWLYFHGHFIEISVFDNYDIYVNEYDPNTMEIISREYVSLGYAN